MGTWRGRIRMASRDSAARSPAGSARDAVAALATLLTFLSVGAGAQGEGAAPGPHQELGSAASPAAGAEPLWQIVDRNITVLKMGFAGAALGVLALGYFLRGSGRPRRWIWPRRIALGGLAILCFCANYNFFIWTGIAKTEFYHYYLGSKYAPEHGYFGILECSVAASFEQGLEDPEGHFWVTDLRTNERRLAPVLNPRGPRCNGAFSAGRWAAFQADVARFRAIPSFDWRKVVADHGYNPTPIWTFIARPLSSLFSVEMDSLWVLARLDLVLLLTLLAAVGWAFGFEALCLAAIAWGANPHTRYNWIGDAFLRYAWVWAWVVGLCLLRRKRYGGAGALLTLSTLLRVFPALFMVGYALGQLRGWLRDRRFDPGLRRFVAGALIAGFVLAIGGAATSGRGPGVYLEFWQKISGMTTFVAMNSLGLKHLLSYTHERPEPELLDGVWTVPQERIQEMKRETLAKRRILYFAAIALFLGLFWRASRTALDWEAAAMGATLMPVLTTPGSYYSSFVMAAAMLATRRPRVGMALMAVLVAWSLAIVEHGREPMAFVSSSAIGLGFLLYVLIEMQWAPAPEPAEG